MPLSGSESSWAALIITELAGADIPQNRPLEGDELKKIWEAITTAHIGNITSESDLKSDGATASHPSGAPASIIALPGVIL